MVDIVILLESFIYGLSVQEIILIMGVLMGILLRYIVGFWLMIVDGTIIREGFDRSYIGSLIVSNVLFSIIFSLMFGKFCDIVNIIPMILSNMLILLGASLFIGWGIMDIIVKTVKVIKLNIKIRSTNISANRLLGNGDD